MLMENTDIDLDIRPDSQFVVDKLMQLLSGEEVRPDWEHLDL